MGGDTRLDFGDFSLSEMSALGTGDTASSTRPGDLAAEMASDPMSRKLELAEEFRQIGDVEGARDLLEEVVARATGTLRAKAQTMLDNLG